MKYNIEPNIYKVDNDNKSLIYGESNYIDLYNIIKQLRNKYNIYNIIDVGSGCGKLLIYLTSQFNDIYFEGIEIQKNRFQQSIINIKKCCFDNIYCLRCLFPQIFQKKACKERFQKFDNSTK